jgi:hypothetical protein
MPAAWATMATAMIFDSPGGTQAQYDRGHAAVTPDNRPPAGLRYRVTGPTETGWRVVEVSESPSAADRCFREALGPALQRANAPAGPPQVFPVYTFMRACLKHCQSPLTFLMHRWQRGYAGTLRLGLRHALYCVGCCWGLMAVLVAAGAMGLQWVLLIAVVVFLEKLVPRGERTARIVGVAVVLLGVAVAARPEVATVLRGHTMAM